MSHFAKNNNHLMKMIMKICIEIKKSLAKNKILILTKQNNNNHNYNNKDNNSN